MKKIITFIIFSTVLVAVNAQKKPNINKAKLAFDKGKLIEAKDIIDRAISFEKTVDKAKTWYYRGLIYMALDTSGMDKNAMETSIEAFNKALELDPQQKNISTITLTGIENVDSKLLEYYSYYYTGAVEAYNEENNAAAADKFERAHFVNSRSDTVAILNAAYAASMNEDHERAKKNFNKCIELGIEDKNIYLQLYNYAIQDKNYEKALSIVKNAKNKFPNDGEFSKYEIGILVELDRTEDALKELEESLKLDPENGDLLFTYAVLKEELEDKEGAAKAYESCINANPEHFNCNFNYGVFVFNQANVIIKKRNNLPINDRTEYKRLTKLIDERLQNALPVWKKIHILDEKDQTALETLSYIYNYLNMNVEADEIKEKLDNLNEEP